MAAGQLETNGAGDVKLMYAMVDASSNVYPNLSRSYMAGLMTAPMLIIEVLLMRSM